MKFQVLFSVKNKNIYFRLVSAFVNRYMHQVKDYAFNFEISLNRLGFVMPQS